MYVVLLLLNGKPHGKAQLMTKDHYERACKCYRGNPADLFHVVDMSRIDEYPSELFESKEVKRHVKKYKK